MSRTMLSAHFKDEDLLDLLPALQRCITFPVLASPKIDGIRFTGVEAQAQSRAGKVLPNHHFQRAFATGLLNYCDGEVVVGDNPRCTDVSNGTLFNRTQSAIMTAGGMPRISLHLFDYIKNPGISFGHRTLLAKDRVTFLRSDSEDWNNVHYVEHTLLHHPEAVLEYEQEALLAGYEGIMLRSPNAPYKFGRSTLKQQGLIKIKRFKDDEATVIGFEALERNTNPILPNAFGLAKRSSHKAGKIADNLLGKLVVTHPTWGEFRIGSGFDVATREHIWNNKDSYRGRLVTYKYQPHGTMNAPRAPIFKGFRDRIDT